MQVHIHNTYIAHGFFADPAVDAALYWASRLASNLESTQTYAVMRDKLLSIIWENFRVVKANTHAIDARGPEALNAWKTRYLHRLSAKQMVDGRQFAKALDTLVNVARVAAHEVGDCLVSQRPTPGGNPS